MYIKDIIKSKKVTVSFEVFPPKPNTPMESVMSAAKEISHTSPDWMSVTYGAGGTNAANTVNIASRIQNDVGVTALSHLTCVTATRDHVHKVLDELKSANIQNVLALRGDFPADGQGFDRDKMEYKYAYELVHEIKKYGDFCIGAACYPEGHVENDSKDNDLDNLKNKVDEGVDFLVTQLYFDNSSMYSFLYRSAAKGIHVPVAAGIMPVTGRNQIKRMCALSGITLTPKFKTILDKFYDKPDALRQAGIAYATEQIIDLIANDVTNIHIYSMNKPEIAKKIMDNIKDIVGA